MQILLTNDDGIDAPGLRALYEAVSHAFRVHSPEILVFAPDRERSECSHSVTGGPFEVLETKPGWYSVTGTPADCVRVALHTTAPSPTFVFSGVNAGANLGVNTMVSGTVAAAREAMVHGRNSMSISHYRRPDVAKTWDHVPRWLENVLQDFAARAQDPSQEQTLFWNVNLPAIEPTSDPPVERCVVDNCPLERVARTDGKLVSFDLDFHGRPRNPGSDVDRCFSGSITVSELDKHF